MPRAIRRASGAAAILVAAGLALAGCGDDALGLAFSAEPGDATPLRRSGVPAFAMLDGAVNVQGPEGFCVDTATSRPARGFAVLATCGLISDIPAVPAIEGLITVQVGEPGSAVVAGSEVTMRDLLTSGPGVQLLATDGRPESITIDRIDTREGLVVVHFTDAAPPAIAGLEQREWRAFLDLGERLATISVRGFARAPLREDTGLVLLDQAVFALQAVNKPAE